jgi:hypothetical protein
VIEKLFGIDKGAVRTHSQRYKKHHNTVLYAGRPPVFSEAQINDFVAVILEAFHNRRPLTLVEIRAIIPTVFNQEILHDSSIGLWSVILGSNPVTHLQWTSEGRKSIKM